MRVFVTGATGVIGRRAVPMLQASGHVVTAFARNPQQQRTLQASGVNAVLASFDDQALLCQAVAGHDAVLNLATHIPSSGTKMLFRRFWRENDYVRRVGSAALADAVLATGVPRFIQESFAPVYAEGGDRWLDEGWPLRPTRYNESVLDAERSAARVAEAGRTGVVLRFGAFYGPDSRMLHDMLKVLRRGWSPIPGAPTAYLSSITHDDAATAAVAALGASSGVYNASDDEPLRRGEWMQVMAAALSVPTPKPVPAWLVKLSGPTAEMLARSVRMSNAKLRSETGWAPRFPSVREGAASLRDTNKRQVV